MFFESALRVCWPVLGNTYKSHFQSHFMYYYQILFKFGRSMLGLGIGHFFTYFLVTLLRIELFLFFLEFFCCFLPNISNWSHLLVFLSLILSILLSSEEELPSSKPPTRWSFISFLHSSYAPPPPASPMAVRTKWNFVENTIGMVSHPLPGRMRVLISPGPVQNLHSHLGHLGHLGHPHHLICHPHHLRCHPHPQGHHRHHMEQGLELDIQSKIVMSEF